jgi:hypothetical protein
MLNTLKCTLPEENIQIIDELITRCEHGYFLGYLVEKTIMEFENKHPTNEGIRSNKYLMKRMESFRKNREKKVMLASKEAFDLTDEVKEKLNRMFLFEKV